MDASAWPEENWMVLGEQIAKARRIKGWDQAELARRSGNSPNTVSNYERGRATRSRRIPAGVDRVAYALGWPPDAARRILAGEAPEAVLGQLDIFDLSQERQDEEAHARRFEGRSLTGPAPPRVGLMSDRDIELTQSGHLAQDIFMRQAKRYRKLQDVTLGELAKRIAELGVDLPLKDLKRLEDGTRLLRVSEAKAIARALSTTVEWLLGSGFSSDAPDEMKWPPNDEELQAEAKAVERRMAEVGAQVNAAHMQYVQAREREEQARQQAEMARLMLQQVSAQQREMERHYQYLLGRIDSIRAAKGDETVIQFHPVYEDQEE